MQAVVIRYDNKCMHTRKGLVLCPSSCGLPETARRTVSVCQKQLYSLISISY